MSFYEDAPKEYVDQCGKALKIQEDWIPMRGDRVVVRDHSELKVKETLSFLQ